MLPECSGRAVGTRTSDAPMATDWCWRGDAPHQCHHVLAADLELSGCRATSDAACGHSTCKAWILCINRQTRSGTGVGKAILTAAAVLLRFT